MIHYATICNSDNTIFFSKNFLNIPTFIINLETGQNKTIIKMLKHIYTKYEPISMSAKHSLHLKILFKSPEKHPLIKLASYCMLHFFLLKISQINQKWIVNYIN